MKQTIYLLMFLLCIGIVLADYANYDLSTTIKVTLYNNTNFSIMDERNNTNTYVCTDSFTNREIVIPFNRNLTFNCMNSSSCERMENLCYNLVNNLTSLVVESTNTTDSDKFSRLYTDCFVNLSVCRSELNSTREDVIEFRGYKESNDACQNQRDSYEKAYNECKECPKQKTDVEGQRIVYAIAGGLAGLAIGYAIWGRKRGKEVVQHGGSAEFQEPARLR